MVRSDDERVERGWLGAQVGRREALRASAFGVGGLAAAALVGCGSDDDDDNATPTSQGTSTAGATGTAQAQEPDYVTQARADGAPYPYNYAEPEGAPKSGGTLVVGVTWDVGTWDTNKTSGAQAVSVANVVANRLIGMVTGPELSKFKIELQPELAKSWDVSPDGLSYTFHLQENVKFQNVAPVNGRPLQAEDVKLAYERMMAGGVNKPFFGLVDSVTAVDTKTVKVTMKKPDADFLFPLAARGLPILPAELYDQNLIDSTIIGSGPGIFDKDGTKAGSAIRVKSNPDYWEGKPHMDGVEFRLILDTSARTAAFRTGQIDHGAGTTPPEVQELLKSNPDTQICVDPVLVGIFVVGMNASSPKFSDVRVRRALSLAFDREKLLQLRYNGAGGAYPAFPWPFLFDSAPDESEFGDYWVANPEESKKLLSAAGAENLAFEQIISSTYGQGNLPNDEAMVQMFKEVGITMNLRPADGQTFNAQYYAKEWAKSGTGEAIQGFSTATPTATGYFYDNMHSQSAKNYFGVTDSMIDQWADQQRSELNPATRKELQRKIWDRTLDEVLRLDGQPVTFSPSMLQPWVRYYRWNGPYIGVHSYYDWGMGYHKAWLDK